MPRLLEVDETNPIDRSLVQGGAEKKPARRRDAIEANAPFRVEPTMEVFSPMTKQSGLSVG